MQDFRKRRAGRADIARMILGCIGVVVLTFVAFIAARGAWGVYGKFAEASLSDTQAKQQLAALIDQKAKVAADVAALSSTRGLEGEIRDRYGLVKPGEGEIDIVRQPASSSPEGMSKQSWWAKFWAAIAIW